MKKSITILAFFFGSVCATCTLHAQISLEECYQLARKNYPLIRQHDLIEKTKSFSVENAGKAYLPQFNIGGQATYQSDVTTFPTVPGLKFPIFYKDQYKIYGEVDQLVYDGGTTKNLQEKSRTESAIQHQSLELSLYEIRNRINQLYFGVLLIDEQLKQIDLQKQDIQSGIDKASASLANGTAFRSSVDELQAEKLKADRSRIEFSASRKGYLEVLSMFINRPLDEHLQLALPPTPVINDSLRRPEILLFDYRGKAIDLQERTIRTNLRPRFNLFLQGGYSRPGLDFLDPEFAWYYIGGIRLNWSLGSLYTRSNDRRLQTISRESLEIEKETFVFNTQTGLKQEAAEISRFRSLIHADEEIITLRTSVKKAALAQFENGVITSHEYINQVNAENLSRQELILHQVQLLFAEYNYQHISGN